MVTKILAVVEAGVEAVEKAVLGENVARGSIGLIYQIQVPTRTGMNIKKTMMMIRSHVTQQTKNGVNVSLNAAA